MIEWYIRLLVYVAGGVLNEIIFTSLKGLYYHRNYMLNGNTQLWVVGIYAFGGMYFERLDLYINDFSLLWRCLVLTGNVYFLEYTSGRILTWYLGRCPWHYTGRGSVHGCIKLSYFPFWMIFSAITDAIINFMMRNSIVPV